MHVSVFAERFVEHLSKFNGEVEALRLGTGFAGEPRLKTAVGSCLMFVVDEEMIETVLALFPEDGCKCCPFSSSKDSIP
jgi:hypothetical protein